MGASVCHEPCVPVLGETGESPQPTAVNPSAAQREAMWRTKTIMAHAAHGRLSTGPPDRGAHGLTRRRRYHVELQTARSFAPPRLLAPADPQVRRAVDPSGVLIRARDP